jgi:hypothetical protein
MSYTIIKTDGTTLTQLVDGDVDQTATDITLIGKNASGYGTYVNDNFVWLLENFANTAQPNHPITGQLWFDTSENRLKVYDGTVFKVSGGTIVSPTVPSSISAGDIWIDSARQQLYFNDGTSTKLAGPLWTATQGTTGFYTEDVVDSVGVSHTILQLSVAGTPIGIWSKDTFTPAKIIAGYTGNVYTGFNAGTYSGIKLHTPVTQADYLLSADGITRKTAANFLSTTDSSATTGTITIQNAIPLVLGEGSSTEFNATTSIFQIKSNTTNQNYGINLLSGTGLDRAFFINATTKQTGIYTDTPTATLDVNGDTRIRGNLTVEGSTTTINTTNLEISDKMIVLGKTETPTNSTAAGGGITVAAGADVDKTLTWIYNTGTPADSSWTSSENIDLVIGKSYKINGHDTLTATVLGDRVVTSYLTSVGDLINVQAGNLKIADNILFYNNVSQSDGDIVITPKGTGTVDMSGHRISAVDNPVFNTDAANKTYVDVKVRSATLGFALTVPLGYRNDQIASKYLANVFEAGDHENNTVLNVVISETGGPIEIRQFQLLSSQWQYQQTLYPRPDIPGREGETLP